MVAVPPAEVVTTPVDEPTEAIVALVLQVPPEVVSDKVSDEPAHTENDEAVIAEGPEQATPMITSPALQL
jgi:hypothetical protein